MWLILALERVWNRTQMGLKQFLKVYVDVNPLIPLVHCILIHWFLKVYVDINPLIPIYIVYLFVECELLRIKRLSVLFINDKI